MGDYYSGSITIGGRLPAARLDEFLKTLGTQGVTLDWGETPFRPTSESQLREALTEEGYLHFKNDDLRNGCYENLKEWLMTHHLGFIRRSSSYGEYPAEEVHFRKGMALRSYATDENGQTLIHQHRVDRACRALERGRPDLAYRLLCEAIPTHLPPLPPLTIGLGSRHQQAAPVAAA